MYRNRPVATHATRHITATIGANVRRGRDAANLTQHELGLKVGVPGVQISKWERGEHRPSAHYEKLLADVLFEGEVAALYREPDEVRVA